jgi:hypothetical protein
MVDAAFTKPPTGPPLTPAKTNKTKDTSICVLRTVLSGGNEAKRHTKKEKF